MYKKLGEEIGEVVEKKQAAYGDSFGKSGGVLRLLYPNGIPLAQLDDALVVVRVIDKLFRIATDKDALGESPWGDICGYALLALQRDRLNPDPVDDAYDPDVLIPRCGWPGCNDCPKVPAKQVWGG